MTGFELVLMVMQIAYWTLRIVDLVRTWFR